MCDAAKRGVFVSSWFVLTVVLLLGAVPTAALAQDSTKASDPPSGPETVVQPIDGSGSSLLAGECTSQSFAYQNYGNTWTYGGRTVNCTETVAQIFLDNYLYAWDDIWDEWVLIEEWTRSCTFTISCSNGRTNTLWSGLWRVATFHYLYPVGGGGPSVAVTARNFNV